MISLLAYNNERGANEDQRRADEAAVANTQRHYAEQVSFLAQPDDNPHGTEITIENASIAPVYDATLDGTAFKLGMPGAVNQFTLRLGNKPPCSVGVAETTSEVANILLQTPGVRTRMVLHLPWKLGVYWMSFLDRDGRRWLLLDSENLMQVKDSNAIEMHQIEAGKGLQAPISVAYTRATNCS